MAVIQSNVTDLAAAPAQDPAEITADADAVLGITGRQESIAGEPEAEIGGSTVFPMFGFAGSFVEVDDAVFVPGVNNGVGTASQWVPGQRFSIGYQNEAHQREGVIVEQNMHASGQRPDSTYVTERPA